MNHNEAQNLMNKDVAEQVNSDEINLSQELAKAHKEIEALKLQIMWLERSYE